MSPEVKGERKCPSCHQQSIRYYYHELNKARNLGVSWFWCAYCLKCIHFSGEPLSSEYKYDDPLGMDEKSFGLMEAHGWYKRLNQLWQEGLLPQSFVKRK